jgi:hypothetical protein
MTKSEEARDKLRCWALIDRCRKVNFSPSPKWLKYGMPPTSAIEIVDVNLNAIIDNIHELFESDSVFYRQIRRQK